MRCRCAGRGRDQLERILVVHTGELCHRNGTGIRAALWRERDDVTCAAVDILRVVQRGGIR